MLVAKKESEDEVEPLLVRVSLSGMLNVQRLGFV